MTWNPRMTVLVGTILLPILAATGCTGTDVVKAGNGTVRFEINLTNVNDSARFETIFFTLNQLALRPADPDADAALGSRDLALITSPLSINLAGDFFGSSDVPVPSGSYVIERVDIVAVRATDLDGTGSPNSCAEYVASFPSTGGFSYQNGADLNDVVSLSANTPNVITLTIDLDTFFVELARGWRCIPTSSQCSEPWCLRSNFSSSLFKQNADSYFSFD